MPDHPGWSAGRNHATAGTNRRRIDGPKGSVVMIYQTPPGHQHLFGDVRDWYQVFESVGGITVHGAAVTNISLMKCRIPCKAFVARDPAFGEVVILANHATGDAERYAHSVAASVEPVALRGP
jgi:hypothetical protein